MFRMLGDLFAPAGPRAALAVLTYHRVLPAPDPLLHDEMDAACFGRQMGMLAAEFNVLPLGEACARLARGALPARAVSLTFDDGYADNEHTALPILRSLGLRATFFIATGYIDRGAMFNDVVIEAVRSASAGTHDLSALGLGRLELDGVSSRRAAADRLIDALKYRLPDERRALSREIASGLGATPPERLMMSADQIRHLRRCGMELGAHTVDHPILAVLGDGEAREQIVAGKRALEDLSGSRVTLFAYPNGKPGGDYGPRHVRMVREAGYAAAVSTVRDVCDGSSDLYELPRIGPWDRDPRRLALRLLLMCAGRRAARLRPVPPLESEREMTAAAGPPAAARNPGKGIDDASA